MNNVRRFLLAATAAVVVAGCSQSTPPAATEPIVRIGQHQWKVEISNTEQTRHQGLSGRRSVPEGTGMLFVFPSEQELSFWMKDCFVPIDVAYISADHVIVSTYAMSVEPDPANPVKFYDSNHTAMYALEVAGGTVARLGIKPGDRIELLGPAATAKAAP